jgi:hypothetical protein
MNIERTEREKEWKNREKEKNGFSISSKFFFCVAYKPWQ